MPYQTLRCLTSSIELLSEVGLDHLRDRRGWPAGGPSAMRRPELSTITRSHTSITSRMTCSIMNQRDALLVADAAQQLRRARRRRFALRPTAGSSSRTIFGSPISVRAISIRRCWPKERAVAGRSANCDMPTKRQRVARRFLHLRPPRGARRRAIEPGAKSPVRVAAGASRSSCSREPSCRETAADVWNVRRSPSCGDGAGLEADDRARRRERRLAAVGR